MIIAGVAVATIGMLVVGSQVFACLKMRKLYRELQGYRDTLSANKKTLGVSYEQEDRFKYRLDEVLSNPGKSDNPEWEIDGCETMLKNLPKQRSRLRTEIREDRQAVSRTIRRMRKWQKILMKS